MVTFAMVFLVGAFGMNFPIFASTMAIEFGQDADGFGLLSSILAIGSLDRRAARGAPRPGAHPRRDRRHAAVRRRRARSSAFMPTYWAYAATLMFTGFAVVTMLTTANGYVQTTTAAGPARPGARAVHGDPDGRHADRRPDRRAGSRREFGPRVAILVGAVAALVAFGIGATWLLASGRLHRHEDEALPAHDRRDPAACRVGQPRGVQRRGRVDDADPAVAAGPGWRPRAPA